MPTIVGGIIAARIQVQYRQAGALPDPFQLCVPQVAPGIPMQDDAAGIPLLEESTQPLIESVIGPSRDICDPIEVGIRQLREGLIPKSPSVK